MEGATSKRSVYWSVAFVFLLILGGCSKSKEGKPSKKETPSVQTETSQREEGYQFVAVKEGGTISGRVVFKGKKPSSTLPAGKDQEVCGKEKKDPSLTVNERGEVRFAVVQIVDIRKGKAIDPVVAVLDQRGCEYHPHVLAVPAGTTIEILNSDGILHNVHTFSQKNDPFNRAQPKYLKKITHVFKEPEIISVKCDVHGWMSAWIYVAGHPYYDTTTANGAFKLEGVPPGNYTLEVWHEELGKQRQEVTVGPNESAKVVFEYVIKK